MGLVNNTLALVVTYNRLPDLKVCIESLRHQSCSGFDVLVVNNTKVIPARLFGVKQGGSAAIEVLLLKETNEKNCWEVL